jgi:protein-disulfide isomerase/uncharacterized membrane protein
MSDSAPVPGSLAADPRTSETPATDDAPSRSPARRAAIRSWRLLLVEAVALAGAAVSGLLLLQHHGDVYATATVNQVCGETGAPAGCETVARSAYSEYNGIPLAAIGLHFYFSLALLLMFALLFRDELLDAGAFLALAALAAALLVDVMLLGVQAFAIKAFCKLCLLTYLLNVVALLLLLPARHFAGRFVRTLGNRNGRAALASWALSSLTFALTVAALNWALGYRGREQAAAILGTPPPPQAATSVSATPAESAVPTPQPEPATPAPSETPAADAAPAELEAQLRAAREEAQRLQQVLDDPKKLEQYFADKAMGEFERAAVQNLPLESTPFKGPENAPIRVVEFSDFLCPFCRSIAGAFANYLPRSGNRVAVYFKNYPLDQTCNAGIANTIHAGACNLALGAICANEQGRFWPYHDKVFAGQLTNPQAADVAKLAASAGLDAAPFEACLASQKAKDRLAAEIQEGNRSGVKATPTLFLNGKLLPRVNDFLAAVEKEAARLGLPPLPPPPHAPHPQTP